MWPPFRTAGSGSGRTPSSDCVSVRMLKRKSCLAAKGSIRLVGALRAAAAGPGALNEGRRQPFAPKLLIRATPYKAMIAAPSNPIDVSWRAKTMWFGTLVVTQLKNRVNCVAGSVLDRSSMTIAGGQRHAL